MLLILYGSPGSGKTFIGQWLMNEYGFHFYDADIHLTDEMKASLHNKQPFTDAMRSRFFSIVTNHMKSLLKRYEKLVMAQAISRKIYRDQIARTFPSAKFICIETSDRLRRKRLNERADWVTPDWVGHLLAQQEPPSPDHFCLKNIGDQTYIQQQFELLFASC